LSIKEVRFRSEGSFKVKLVAYFLLLSLLPIAAAFWGFTAVAGQSETRRVDARLQAGLRAALATYQERLDSAQRTANSLASSRTIQLELARNDLPELVFALRGTTNILVTGTGGFKVGHIPADSLTRSTDVVTSQGFIGRIVVGVAIDSSLVGDLRKRSGLASADALALLFKGRVLASSPTVVGSVHVPVGQSKTVSVGGSRYRVVAAPALSDDPRFRLAALSPQSLIDAANSASRNRLLLGLLASLLLVSFVAYVEGRSIVRTLRSLSDAANAIARGRLGDRVAVRGHDEFAALGSAFNDMAGQLQARLADLEEERERLRVAITRFGEALSATHDVTQLLRVIVEAAVEATSATGARLVTSDGELVAAGDPDAEGATLELPLSAGRTAFGTLTLVGESFDEEQAMSANSLASHAAIALENARLHQIVERQALVDGLTGISNRRHCEDSLSGEIARADRLGTPLTLVLADLDDFKSINDIHGHAVGDEVLKEFAEVLRATVRESDLAGRWGGEEFLLLLPGADGEGGAQLADRVRRGLAERTFLGKEGAAFTVGCSFGVAQHAEGGDERELFANADRALYRAKRRGKNCVELNEQIQSF
jgi:diguanylate cyclase (GGDEF)-like protein